MASIASPRTVGAPASGASTPTVSSRRTSLDTTRTMSPARSAFGSGGGSSGPGHSTPTTAAPGSARRNRAALRDYYNLKPAATAVRGSSVGAASTASSEATATTTATTTTTDDDDDGAEEESGGSGVRVSALDGPDFSAEAYVAGVLGREGLAGVLRAEAALLNEIRELDGERKALVYDNYSRLIAATDTIRGLRLTMLPLQTGTRELKGMVDEIARTAGELSDTTTAAAAAAATAATGAGTEAADKSKEEQEKEQQEKELKRRQRATVKWVIESPRRLAAHVQAGEKEKAEEEWKAVQGLLDKWKGTDGVEKVRQGCLAALEDESERA